ncbi:ABC transporter ATP-binding protein [Carnobacterium inhibens]|uniref:Multidrug ABC transporter ATP-binding protein n=1 Tax=Carnobacterium inhibens subsp. gilichinskyi TaxID=1266845 RepID=U5S7C9_9LACT|nr:ABC transporter ATP-binding protein [Carnobacterium inhibens]AGY81109.1 multidrug ABC transporter ATP-binding protein [Carnobacterium inhibens subsp. gilichinskyi]
MVRLLRYAKNYRHQIILGPFFKFLEAFFELLLPLMMAKLIDEGIAVGNSTRVWQMAGWMVLLTVAGGGCALICQYFSSIASQGFGTELRNQMMRKINQFSHDDLNIFGTDTLVTRMTNDINQLQLALAMLIRLVVRAPFLSVGSVLMAFIIDARLGLLYLLLLPIFCGILYLIIRYAVPLYQKVQQHLDRLNKLIAQNLSGVRVIRAYARKETDTKVFAKTTDELATINEKVSNISALLSPSTTLIMNLGVIILLYLGGFSVNEGTLQQGQVLALISYMNQMLLALIVVSNLVVVFTRAYASGQRVNEILDTEPSLVSPENGKVEKQLNQALIEFNHVDFRYSKDAGLSLTDIDFSIEDNTVIGITGGTGSGKTTLTQLIPRFYDASAGSVNFLGLDVKEWDLEELRKQIKMAPQTAVLFHGTIRENLQWGKTDATDDECWKALKTAQCLEFVQKLPNKLDTLVMENGKNFSGGQRQRLTIARAIISKPKVVILDDSLSALDYQTDLDLREALKNDLNGTIIVISQRIRSLQQAKQILLMDSGRIAAIGTHEELLKHSTAYQELVASQEEV